MRERQKTGGSNMNENNDFRSEEQGFSDPNNLYHYN